uniref:Uncharacterized protein n=1 Tax=Oryza nivara TaxID=4536 RepID=A0A0E0JA97_ORYNI
MWMFQLEARDEYQRASLATRLVGAVKAHRLSFHLPSAVGVNGVVRRTAIAIVVFIVFVVAKAGGGGFAAPEFGATGSGLTQLATVIVVVLAVAVIVIIIVIVADASGDGSAAPKSGTAGSTHPGPEGGRSAAAWLCRSHNHRCHGHGGGKGGGGDGRWRRGKERRREQSGVGGEGGEEIF